MAGSAYTYDRASGGEGVGRGRTSSTHDLNPPLEIVRLGEADGPRHDATAGGAIDRNTSIRSILTLPAYNATPGESEQVLGREGERGGVDVVVEYPETVEEEEERRESEMEALYQLRMTRQAEIIARDERRRARRAAREAGDFETLHELQRQAREREREREQERAQARARASSAASGTAPSISGNSDTTLPIPPARVGGRERRISSVSYADVGLARADGTRIRASSVESERPLLDGAAAMGDTSRPNSGLNMHSALHTRSNSAMSLSSTGSNEYTHEGVSQEIDLGVANNPGFDPPDYEDQTLPSSTGPSNNEDHPIESMDRMTTTTTTTEATTEAMTPQYTDAAPSYESPSRIPPRLPSVRVLPSIQVTGTMTPNHSNPGTPISRPGGSGFH